MHCSRLIPYPPSLSGIGLALAHEFVRHGAHVTLVARTASKLAQAVQELKDAAAAMNQGSLSIGFQAADVTQPSQVIQERIRNSC